ncbi:MAG: ATP-binding cassette domain-containing protein, partial [Candidatus Bathyarchaeota archaeon]
MKNLNISLIGRKDLGAKHTRGHDLIKVVGVGDLRIHEGETVGLIGPSATGKTVTAKAILGILQPIGAGKPEWEIEGEVLFKGRDLLKLSEEELNELRGNE